MDALTANMILIIFLLDENLYGEFGLHGDVGLVVVDDISYTPSLPSHDHSDITNPRPNCSVHSQPDSLIRVLTNSPVLSSTIFII